MRQMTGLLSMKKELDFAPSCLNRVIKVISFESIDDILPLLAPYRSFLQTVGVAASPKELFQWAELLGKKAELHVSLLWEA
ncbi:hypothetical protein GCM10020331_061280 [Ectobacillus funiculus]